MPVITISRMYGSGGSEVAERVANAFGWPVFDNAIVDAIAEEMDRAMQRLELPGAPKPYHISYKITEVEANDVVASLGSTTTRRHRHFVNLEVRVRVGLPPNPYEFDMTVLSSAGRLVRGT